MNNDRDIKFDLRSAVDKFMVRGKKGESGEKGEREE
jgi:hypothetical protein